MTVDIRHLLEQLSKLSKEPLKEQATSNVRQLPLGAPKGKVDPGTQAMNQMGVVLTKPGEKPAEPAAPAKPAAAHPGQKNLFALPKIEPETPAVMPRQPWLDPKGAKEPAFMRKAAGVKPSEHLGVIGGTGPDAKFAKLPPAAANEPSIPKTSASVIKMPKMPALRGSGGSEYVNVPVGGVGKWKDEQYAKDVAAQLQKFPDDENLKAELSALQKRGLGQASKVSSEPSNLAEPTAQPAPQPATQAEPERGEAGRNAKPVTVPAVAPGEPKKIEPATVSYDTDKWMRQHGVVKEFADEFEDHINNVLKEQGIPGLIRRLFVRGKPKAPEVPPTVTPQKPVQMPKDVETPAYVRKAEKNATPEPKKPTQPAQAANDPSMPPAAKGDIGKVVPGPRPFEPPRAEPVIPKPLPGKPGSVTKQRKKLIPPVLPADEPGGGKPAAPEPAQPQPIRVDEPDADSQIQTPSEIDVPTLPGPLPPNSPFVTIGPDSAGSKTQPQPPEKPAEQPPEKPAERPTVNTTPLTKDQIDRINRNDREAAQAQADREKAATEPTKPAPSTAPAKPSASTGGTGGSGGGQGGGQGTGTGTGTGSGIKPGYDPDSWMQQHGVVKESRAIKYLLKDFKKFVNKPRT